MTFLRNDILPCLAFVTFLLVLFGFLAYTRYLRHKEIIALAEKGLSYPERRNGKDALRWGIVIAATGLALIVGLLPLALRGSWPLLLLGLVPTFFGLSLVLIYVLTRPEEPRDKPAQEPGPLEKVE